ncbi:hypothetical protein G3I27_04720 [Streptomyces sp. SID10692]|uniref:hypothetical protein n=1 Tax=Streptomyces sp. SID10692 TaxID=2706026 RepID=UPI0013D9763D|nr:hypothetical protein [Streptomyces sp. SID10692]
MAAGSVVESVREARAATREAEAPEAVVVPEAVAVPEAVVVPGAGALRVFPAEGA